MPDLIGPYEGENIPEERQIALRECFIGLTTACILQSDDEAEPGAMDELVETMEAEIGVNALDALLIAATVTEGLLQLAAAVASAMATGAVPDDWPNEGVEADPEVVRELWGVCARMFSELH